LKKAIALCNDDSQNRHSNLSRVLEGLDTNLRNQLTEVRGEHHMTMQKHGADMNQALTDLANKHHMSYTQLQQYFRDHKAGIDQQLTHLPQSMRDLIEQEKMDRMGHHGDLSSRLELIERGSSEFTKNLASLHQRQSVGNSGFSELFAEHKASIDSQVSQHKREVQDSWQQERAERQRHASSLMTKIEILEGAVLKDDDDVRHRLERQLELKAGEVSREDFDSAIQRLWQAMDTHTHAFNEPAPTRPAPTPPQVLEEVIVRDPRTGQVISDEIHVAPQHRPALTSPTRPAPTPPQVLEEVIVRDPRTGQVIRDEIHVAPQHRPALTSVAPMVRRQSSSISVGMPSPHIVSSPLGSVSIAPSMTGSMSRIMSPQGMARHATPRT